MKIKNWEIDIKLILWGIAMAIFLMCMADIYCRMMYGGGLFYVILEKNEISEEDRVFLEERGPLVYGETLDSFPAQIYDASLRESNGFAIDLMKQLEWELESEIVFKPTLWPKIFEELEKGESDIIQISYSKEREEKYYLTAPIYRNRGVVFLKDGEKEIKRLRELEGQKLAGIKEDYALMVLKEKYPGLKILECNGIDECAKLLREGEIDGIVADEQNLMYYIQGENLFQDYYILEENVYEADVVFAVRKSEKELGRILDKAVYKVRNKNILEKIQKKWFLTSVLYDVPAKEKKYLWGAVLGAGVLGFYLYLFGYIHIRTRTLVKLRTRELEQERGRIQTILDSIPQYVLEVTSQGKIVMVNQQVKDGISKKQISFFDDKDMKIWEQAILEILKSIPQKQDVRKELKIGHRWYRIICSNIQERQDNNNLILVVDDITLMKIQERKSSQNEKMIAIGQLAAGVSHELKNPLEIICNYCYALKKGILHTQEDIADTAEVIEEEAREANKIVESLLSFARQAPQDIRNTELKPVLENIMRLQETVLNKRNIKTKLYCQDNLYVHCNPDGIKRIIVNLLMNAAEAISKEKEGYIEVTAVKENEIVKLEIRDNGRGMEEQEIEKVFNPFYSTKVSGTGLGLYLVYQQMREIGGEIQVFSEKDKGSQFVICFPTAEETEEMGE